MPPTVAEPEILRGHSAAAGSLTEVLQQLERHVGCRLWLLSRRGESLLRGRPSPPPAEDRDVTVLRLALPDGGDGVLVCEPLHPGSELDGALLAGIADVVVALVAAGRRHGTETLAGALAGRLEPAVAWDRFRRLGVGDDPLALVLVAPLPGATDGERLHEDLCAACAVDAVTGIEGGVAALLADAALPAVAAALGPSAAVGISGRLMHGAPLDEARTQAAWALERSVAAGGGIVRFTPAEPALAWLSARDDGLEELVRRTLGDLLAYDAEHNSSLLLTLRTYLGRDRQTGHIAALLHIHRHTLAYRLSRIEKLTGRRLDHTADVVELWLALSALSAFRREKPPAVRPGAEQGLRSSSPRPIEDAPGTEYVRPDDPTRRVAAMAQTEVPSPQRSLLDIDRKILEDDIKPLVTPELIEEHRGNPIGFHGDELERVLIYLRKHHLDMVGKYVIVCRKRHEDYRIGVLSGVRGIGPNVLEDEVFSSREEAEHGVFLRRLKDLALA